MKKNKHPTWTTLVLELLKSKDDFMAAPQIAAEVGSAFDQISAALHHLRKHRAVDVIINPDGRGWWYATPVNDSRLYHHDERALETRPRNRKSRSNPKLKRG